MSKYKQSNYDDFFITRHKIMKEKTYNGLMKNDDGVTKETLGENLGSSDFSPRRTHPNTNGDFSYSL